MMMEINFRGSKGESMAAQNSEVENNIRTLLDEYIGIWESRGRRHRYMYNGLVVTSIALSAAISIAGIYDQGRLAGVLGAILAGMLAFQQAFPFGEMSFFYRVGVAEGIILRLDLDTKANRANEIEALELKVETLIRRMAQEIPRGQAGNNVVEDMLETKRAISPTNPQFELKTTEDIS